MIVAFRMKAEPLTPPAYLAVGRLDQATGIFEPLQQLPTSPTLDAVKPVVRLQQGIVAPRVIASRHCLRFAQAMGRQRVDIDINVERSRAISHGHRQAVA